MLKVFEKMLLGGNTRTPLRNLLQPNRVYNIDGFDDLKYIITSNKKIVCELYEMNFALNKIEKQNYRKLCVSSVLQISNNQNMVYDKYNKAGTTLTTTVSGKDIHDIQSILINDLHKNFIYVHTDPMSRFIKITILKYSAPLFKEYEYAYNGKEKQIISREQLLFANIFYTMNPINYPGEYEQKITRKYSGLRIKKAECKSDSSEKPQDTSEKQQTRIKKYKNLLKKHSLIKLQQIAKKRNIKITKKEKDKTVNIKKSTLINKITNKHFKSKL